jgi:Spy/CpxP family protein refolding chaperone
MIQYEGVIMNAMRRTLGCITAAVLIGTGVTLAQPGPGGPQGERPRDAQRDGLGRDAQGRSERGPAGERGQMRGPVQGMMQAIRDLDLSDDQRQAVRAIMEDARGELRQLADDTVNLDPAARAQTMQAAFAQVRKDIEAELTAEQLSKFTQSMTEFERANQRRNQPGQGQIDERLREALGELNLTDEQKIRVDQTLADTRAKVEALRADVQQTDPQVLREQARTIMQETREKIAEILTAEQRAQMLEKMEAARERMEPREGVGRRDQMGPPDDQMGEPGERPLRERLRERRQDREREQSTSPPERRTRVEVNMEATQADSTELPASGVSGSSSLPALPDFGLNRIDGKPLTRDSLRGEPAVLIFGSYTSPSFRDRLPEIAALAEQFDRRARFVVIYTAEAHPVGEWDVQRNRDDKIELSQHATMDDRLAAARLLRDRLGLKLDIAPESMDAPLSATLETFPNGLVVLDGQGNLVARQRNADAYRLRRQLEALCSPKP